MPVTASRGRINASLGWRTAPGGRRMNLSCGFRELHYFREHHFFRSQFACAAFAVSRATLEVVEDSCSRDWPTAHAVEEGNAFLHQSCCQRLLGCH